LNSTSKLQTSKINRFKKGKGIQRMEKQQKKYKKKNLNRRFFQTKIAKKE
jgi:hypothetical protein